MHILSSILFFCLIWDTTPVLCADNVKTETVLASSPLVVQDITFKKKNGTSEIVLIHLNRSSWPSVLHALEDNKPMLEIEWTNAGTLPGNLSAIPVKGQWIRGLRSHYNADSKTLKIILDLNPLKGYEVSQGINEKENVFYVEIGAEHTPQEKQTSSTQEKKTEPLPQKENTAPLVSMINAWKSAWENKDLNSYIAFYHESFKSEGKNRTSWKNGKSSTFNKVQRITVNLSDLKISITEKGAMVFFKQTYQSDDYLDEGYKQLELRKENNDWKIYREQWFAKKPDTWPSLP